MIDYDAIQEESDYDTREHLMSTVTVDDIQRDWEIDTRGEAICVIDALVNGEDIDECLAEHRYWRSGRGRQQEATDAFESGRT